MTRPTCGSLAAQSRSFKIPRSRTGQFCHPFVLACIRLWNGCMSLSWLVNVKVLLKFQSISFFYEIDCPVFLPALRLFVFPFPGTLEISWDHQRKIFFSIATT